jgi:hypothetical protein
VLENSEVGEISIPPPFPAEGMKLAWIASPATVKIGSSDGSCRFGRNLNLGAIARSFVPQQNF